MKKIFKPLVVLAALSLLTSCAQAPSFKAMKKEYEEKQAEYYPYSTATYSRDYKAAYVAGSDVEHADALMHYCAADTILGKEGNVTLPTLFSVNSFTALGVKEEKEVEQEAKEANLVVGTYEISVEKSKEGYYAKTKYVYTGSYDLKYVEVLGVGAYVAASEDDKTNPDVKVVHVGYARVEYATYDVKGLLASRSGEEVYSTAGKDLVQFTYNYDTSYTYAE